MQKQIEINGRKYLCVVVPIDSVRFNFKSDIDTMLYFTISKHNKLDQVENGESILLPINNDYSILGTLNDLSKGPKLPEVEGFYKSLPSEGIIQGEILSVLPKSFTWNESTETILIIQIN